MSYSNNKSVVVSNEVDVRNKIFAVRGRQVMLDVDLAKLYMVSTKRLNEQVKRNKERFPSEFCFKLTVTELRDLRSQFATLDFRIGHTYLSYAFTEQGVAMLSSVLKSKVAIYMSIRIMNAFVDMRNAIVNNSQLVYRLDRMEQKQLETDRKFEQVFDALSSQDAIPKQRIFFNDQVFDN